MSGKIKIDNTEYNLDDLSDSAKSALSSLQFTTNHIKELSNMLALLEKAKVGYIDTLKREMLKEKSGYLFDKEE